MYVRLDTAPTEADPVPDSVPDKYVASLEDQVEFLRDQVRRQQEIIGQQALTMRQLTAGEPREPRESPTPSPAASEGASTTPDTVGTQAATQPPQDEPRRSWWRRMFGG